MDDHIAFNKAAYDTLAPQYDVRRRFQERQQEEVLQPLEQRLRDQFGKGAMVLEVGCGVGLNLSILERHGFQVSGVDISPQMVAYAKRNVVNAPIVEADFTNGYQPGKYHGLVMSAFLHLFPEQEVPAILEKAKNAILPGGYGLISTTKSEESKEGIFEKGDYFGKVWRFRKFWTEEELQRVVEHQGLSITDYYEKVDRQFGKVWMNFIFQA